MRLPEKILLFALIILLMVFTPTERFFWIFVLWTCLLLFIGHLFLRRNTKALNEVTCALFGEDYDGHYKESLAKESQVYNILSELKDESEIYEGMSIAELDNMLKGKYKDRYHELDFWLHFGEIPTNKDRFKKSNKIIIKNYKVFPRPILIFVVKKEKIVKIKETVDDGRSWLWGGY